MSYFMRFLGSVSFFYFYPDFPFSFYSTDLVLFNFDLISKNFTPVWGVVLKGSFCYLVLRVQRFRLLQQLNT